MAQSPPAFQDHHVHYSTRGETRQASRLLRLAEPATEADVLRRVAAMLTDLIRQDRWLILDDGKLLRASEVVGVNVKSVDYTLGGAAVTGFDLALG